MPRTSSSRDHHRRSSRGFKDGKRWRKRSSRSESDDGITTLSRPCFNSGRSKKLKIEKMDLQITIENDTKPRVRSNVLLENDMIRGGSDVEMEEETTSKSEVNKEVSVEQNLDELDLEVGDEFEMKSEASGSGEDASKISEETKEESSSDEDDVMGYAFSNNDDLLNTDIVPDRPISPIVFEKRDYGDGLNDNEAEEDTEKINLSQESLSVYDDLDEPAPPGVEDDLADNERDGSVSRSKVMLPKKIKAEKKDRDRQLIKHFFEMAHFYLIKSNNYENVEIAKKQGVWSTMRLNEMKLNDSFKQAKNVILIFSVKESGRFQGIARLRQNSQKDYSPYPNWLLPPGMSRHVLGGVFKIDWLCKHDLSFSHAMSLRNIWNQNKPIKIGRDGQEIEPQAANQLCSLFPHDEDVDVEHILQISKRFRRQYNEFIPHQPKTFQNFNRRQNSGIRNHFRNRTAPAYTSSGQPARSPLRTDNYQLNSTVSMVSSSQNRQSNGIKKLPSQVSMTHKFRNTTHQSDYSSSRYKLGGLGKSHEDACDEFVRKAKVERSYKSTSSRSSRRSRSKQYSSSSDERYYSDKEESVSPEPPRRKEFKKEKRRYSYDDYDDHRYNDYGKRPRKYEESSEDDYHHGRQDNSRSRRYSSEEELYYTSRDRSHSRDSDYDDYQRSKDYRYKNIRSYKEPRSRDKYVRSESHDRDYKHSKYDVRHKDYRGSKYDAEYRKPGRSRKYDNRE